MKKLIISAAIALFAVSAFAQSNNAKNKQREPKQQSADRDSKDHTDKDKLDNRQYDLNNDGIFSPEEREARKASKMARRDARKADRLDDGLLNGSNGNDNHGRDVSGTARGTMLQGREKGEAVSDVARSNGRNGERMQGAGNTGNPERIGRPAGSGKPAGVGRPAGAGRKNK